MKRDDCRPIFFPFFPNRWHASENVLAMLPEEEGAYIHLLVIAFQDPTCSLPADEAKLAGLSRLRERWPAHRAAVLACFVPHPTIQGRIINPLLFEEWTSAKEEMERRSAQRSVAGQGNSAARKRETESRQTENTTPSVEGRKEGRKEQEEGKKEKTTPVAPKGAVAEPDGFAAFWDAYPATFRKTERKKTAARFAAIIKAGGTVEQIMAGLGRWLESKQWADRHANNGEFIAAPEVFLGTEKHQWNLYPPPAKSLPNGGVVDEYPEL